MSGKIYRAEDIERIVYFGEFRGIEEKRAVAIVTDAEYVYGRLIYQDDTFYILQKFENDSERMIKVIPWTIERKVGWEAFNVADED